MLRLQYALIVIKICNSFEDRLMVFTGIPEENPEVQNMNKH
jgi:hypothetical protein